MGEGDWGCVSGSGEWEALCRMTSRDTQRAIWCSRYESIDGCFSVDGWCGHNLSLPIGALNYRTQHVFVKTQAEGEFGGLVGQHPHGSNDRTGIAYASSGLQGDRGADVVDCVGNDKRDVIPRHRVAERAHWAVNVEPDEILSAITIQIDYHR